MAAIKIGELEVILPSEVKSVQTAYEQVLAVRRPLGPVGEAFARRGIRVHFRGDVESRRASLERRSYTLHRLLKIDSYSYWVACEIELHSVLSEHRFSGVSLVVVLERERDSWEPVLRAEWERSRQDTPGQHAQPHWHVYSTTAEHQARRQLVAIEGSELVPVTEEFTPIDSDDVASGEQQATLNLHLAMAARWHLHGAASPQYEAPDETKVGAWVRGCLEYTRGQLTYLVRKERSA